MPWRAEPTWKPDATAIRKRSVRDLAAEAREKGLRGQGLRAFIYHVRARADQELALDVAIRLLAPPD